MKDQITINVEAFDDFTIYHMPGFTVIEKYSSYAAARKQKIYKDPKNAIEVWKKITNKEISHFDF